MFVTQLGVKYLHISKYLHRDPQFPEDIGKILETLGRVQRNGESYSS